jgi:hypothetical protein
MSFASVIVYGYNITYFKHDVKGFITFFYYFLIFFIVDVTHLGYTLGMSMTEKIRILLVKRGNISEAELARRLGLLPQNFNAKMKRDNFTEGDLRKIAEVMDCDFAAGFILRDTGEEI